MAITNPSVWYIGSDKWSNVTAWPANTSISAGTLVRQNATPTVNNERVFACVVAGTSSNSGEPSWNVGFGSKTNDNTVLWQECTGQPGVNGDTTNSPLWAASASVTQGVIIAISSTLQACTTAGTTKSGSPPAFSATAGVTTGDNTAVWTSLGATSNFSAYAAPFDRIFSADAVGWSPAGSTMYISNGHAETSATNVTLVGGQGTNAAPNKYYCVSNAVAPPAAITTGASLSVTTAHTLFITKNGYYEGIAFNCGAGTNANTPSLIWGGNGNTNFLTTFKNCSFNMLGTGSGATIGASSPDQNGVLMYNCTVTFSNTGQTFGNTNTVQGGTMIGGSIAATGSVPTSLFNIGLTKSGFYRLRGVDLSSVISPGTLVNNSNGWTAGEIALENCKIGNAVTMTSGTFDLFSQFKMDNCDSGSKNYRFYRQNFFGSINQDTTTVNNTNPSSDGTTKISWSLNTSPNVNFYRPMIFEEFPIVQWNSLTSGAHTATIQIASNGSALTNKDIWMELEYFGSSASPISSIVSSRAIDILATPSTYSTSTDSWGGSPTNTQFMQVSFSPQLAGPIKCRIYMGAPVVTAYVNPLIIVN